MLKSEIKKNYIFDLVREGFKKKKFKKSGKFHSRGGVSEGHFPLFYFLFFLLQMAYFNFFLNPSLTKKKKFCKASFKCCWDIVDVFELSKNCF